MEIFSSFLLLIGCAISLVGLVCVAKPMKRLKIPTRKRALIVILAGFFVVSVGGVIGEKQALLKQEEIAAKDAGYASVEEHKAALRAEEERKKKAEEERLAAEKKAEKERLAAEKRAKEDRRRKEKEMMVSGCIQKRDIHVSKWPRDMLKAPSHAEMAQPSVWDKGSYLSLNGLHGDAFGNRFEWWCTRNKASGKVSFGIK